MKRGPGLRVDAQMERTLSLLVLAILMALPGVASAKKKRAKRSRGTVTVPAAVAVGPSAFWFTGPVADDQPFHFGLNLDVYAVIDQAILKKHQKRIPAKYRKMVLRSKEIRMHPLALFLPRSFFISPKVHRTGIYGLTWRPIGFGLSFGARPLRVKASAGLIASYAFIHSDVLPTTHFIRPGLDPSIEVELQLADSFLMSFGWTSQVYLPQEVGGFGFGKLSESIWHVGQAFLALHFRFPYEHSF